MLVVVTTLELDPNHNQYKAKLVEKLTRAAKEHLEQSSEAASFVIMNPLGRWRGG
jgi:phenylpyruvate tautomerase PptA (4-oxalocrotonate tautomerase family)